jgi:hypothetical protein
LFLAFQLASTLKCLLDLLNVSSKLNFYSSIRDIFMLLIFLLVLFYLSFQAFNSSSFPFPFFFFFLFLFVRLSFLFQAFDLLFFKLLIFYLFFVWTSVLSFCLIILVFARMSLRVNNTARWFLMILHACWVSVC